jgi:four helix bundle protein
LTNRPKGGEQWGHHSETASSRQQAYGQLINRTARRGTLKILRFEDLEAWQLSRELTNQIYTLTKRESIRRDFGFIDQIRKAAISIMNNIAEGFERGSNKDFVKFLFIARGSAGEVRSLLYLGLDQAYLTNSEFLECRELCMRCSQVIWGLIRSLRSKSGWITGMKIFLAAIALRFGLGYF